MHATPDMYGLKIGEQAPLFRLEGTDGKTYTLHSFKKDYLMIVFMCNHCPYVIGYIDRIQQLAQQFQDTVQCIGINANDAVAYPQDSFPHMKRFVHENNLSFPYLYDETQAVAKAFHALLTPHVIVVDKKRKVVYNGGIDDNHENETAVREHWLKDALAALIAGEKIPNAETPCIGCSIKWK